MSESLKLFRFPGVGLRPFFSLVCSITLAAPVCAQDAITDIQSPILSYQYAEDGSAAILASGGVHSPFVSFRYSEDFALVVLASGGAQSAFVSFGYSEDFASVVLASGGVQSSFVSFHYPDDLSGTVLGVGGSASPILSYYYFEWPGDDVLHLQSSPLVSYFWQNSSVFPSAVLRGRVTEISGAPIAGATISASVFLASVAQATTDASGNYQMPSLAGGVYTLWATEAHHQGQIRGLTLNASTAVQDFQLRAMPLTPLALQVNRQPALSFTLGPMGSELKIFDGSGFVPITLANSPQSDRVTIVLTHGWVQGAPDPRIMDDPFDIWPLSMAQTLRTKGVTPAIANIVAWDWRYAAMDPPPTPSDASDHTPDQGLSLGKALFEALQGNNTQPLHFIGHSLGTLVNAAAANYLHGDRTATIRQDVSPKPWSSALTHMTLFDQAQIAEIAGKQVLFDGLDPTALDAWKAATGDSPPENWQYPLPVHYKWADNYISIVGLTLPGAVNVFLQKGGAVTGPVDAHSYPIQWYADSIGRPNVSTLGFRQSYEYNRAQGLADANFPNPEISAGSTYDQAPLATDQLVLEFMQNHSFEPLGIFPDSVVQSLIGSVQYAGNVATYVVDREVTGAQRAGQQIAQGFNYTWGVAVQGGQTVVNFLGSAMLQLRLTTSPAGPVSPLGRTYLPQSAGDDLGVTTPMVWLPVLIPTNDVAMAFDFTVSGDPMDDSLVCGIGTNNLFSVQAKYIPTNSISSSRLIDVSSYSGGSNELYFGFLGGTSSNATLQIQNIRFYTFQPPRLNITTSGSGNAWLSWPSTMGNFVVESAAFITTPVWETATNIATITADNYVFTNYWSDRARFFRLRRN